MNFYNQNRWINLLKILYNNDICSETTLSVELNVSSRTIRSDIKALNLELVKYNSNIDRVRTKGYQLNNKENIKLFIDSIDNVPANYDDFEGKIMMIIIKLINAESYISSEKLSDSLYISKATLSNYLKQIKKILKSYNLDIQTKNGKGYKIAGYEKDKRELIFNDLIKKDFKKYIMSFNYLEREIFGNLLINNINIKIKEILISQVKWISDYGVKNLTVLILICLKRNMQLQKLEDVGLSSFKSTDTHIKLYQLLDSINSSLNYVLNKNDFLWITSEFLEENNLYQIELKNSSEKISNTSKIVNELLNYINLSFQENFKNDSILINGLLQHFSTFLPLLEDNKSTKNPLLDIVKSKYPYAYEIALQSIFHNASLKQYNFKENDIGFIALHLAAAIERQQSKNDSLDLVIVNGLGKSVGTLIESSIKRRFLDKINIIENTSSIEFKSSKKIENIDLIVTNVPLNDVDSDIINIDLNKLKDSLDDIESFMKKQEYKHIVSDLFSKELFMILDIHEQKSYVLDQLISLNKYTYEESIKFKQDVLKREELAETNITDFIAIPHAIVPNSKQTKISVCIAPQKVQWNKSDEIGIVFLIATKDKNMSHLQVFFDILSELVEDTELQKKIISSPTYEDFLNNILGVKLS